MILRVRRWVWRHKLICQRIKSAAVYARLRQNLDDTNQELLVIHTTVSRRLLAGGDVEKVKDALGDSARTVARAAVQRRMLDG